MLFNSIGVFARGIALGLGAAVPIGPVNVQIARRALRGRAMAGFALGCGAVTADVGYAALSSLSFARVLNRPFVVNSIGAAGALLLLYLGASCFRAAAKAWKSDAILADTHEAAPRASGRAPHSSYVTGLLMTLLNPMTLAFWFTVVPGTTAAVEPPAVAPPSVGLAGGPADRSNVARRGRPTPSDGASVPRPGKLMQEPAGKLPITCAGVFIGTLTWVITFSGLLAWAGRRRRNWWLAAADVAGGATLIVFAVVMVWRLIRMYV